MEKIYLDHAATTPMHPQVIEAMTQAMTETFGNPSSIHHFGRQARQQLEDARQIVAQSLAVHPDEIIFTSGGTESDNFAILKTAFIKQQYGQHIITTAVEHPAVLETMKYLEKLGFEVTYLPVDQTGSITSTQVADALRDDTILVSIMYANNETGTKMPIRAIGQLLTTHSAVFHTDAVQGYGIETIMADELGIDFLSASAHKINGPKGVGFLMKKANVMLPPLIHGGEQEAKKRSGTENVPGIIGLAKAITLLDADTKQAHRRQYQQYQQMILTALDQARITYQVNGDLQNKVPHILSLAFQDVPNDLLLMQLDLKGIAVSNGSACTAGTITPSHVLEAMYGKEARQTRETIRLSFGLDNTMEQMQYFTKQLIASIQNLQNGLANS